MAYGNPPGALLGSMTTVLPPHVSDSWPKAPAYTAVQAHRTFAQPPPPPPSAPSQVQQAPPQQRKGFPPEVRAYVGRCFEPDNAIPGIEKTEIEAKLKEMITEHMNNGTIYTVDWEHIQTAQQFILEDRKKQQSLLQMPPNSVPHLSPGRKRKSEDDFGDSSDGSTPPWRKTAKTTNAFEDRISYSSKGQATRIEKRTKKRQEELRSQGESKYQADLEKRRQRFGLQLDESPERSPRTVHHSYADDVDLSNAGPVIGTNQSIEKRYLRLTAPPKPETVRPLTVLKKTLSFLKKKWQNEEEKKYIYICDQFKSLRQDLTVQHIKNAFTVDVYETHARIALEEGDLGEYNQCQTQLRALYKLGLGGHPEEFLAYRILYFVHTCNRTDLNDVLANLTKADKAHEVVKYALDVRSATANQNYHKLFRLYLDPPIMTGYLMDRFIGRERLAAMANICKAYVPGDRPFFPVVTNLAI
jgi:SAC3 family protein LENG8/THP3